MDIIPQWCHYEVNSRSKTSSMFWDLRTRVHSVFLQAGGQLLHLTISSGRSLPITYKRSTSSQGSRKRDNLRYGSVSYGMSSQKVRA